MHLADGLASVLTHITMKVPANKEVPLSAVQGHSQASMDFAVEDYCRPRRARGDDEGAIQERLAEARISYVRAANRMESPIEKMILPWLLLADYGPAGNRPPVVHLHDADDVLPPFCPIVFVPQFPFGRFRLDLAVICTNSDSGHKALFTVECDGREFHHGSSSPEKWRADRARDINLAAWGILTVRIKGEEIYKAPSRAADQLAFRVRDWFGA